MNMTKPIKVMIVDDSALVREVISITLKNDPGIQVIATASDPIFAMRKMQAQWPDVLILDIEMPRMDGISFLRKIMSEHPTPVIICSSLAEAGAENAFAALEAGAISIITKPKLGLKSFLEDGSNDIRHAVHAAARANLGVIGHKVSTFSGQSTGRPLHPPTRAPMSTSLSESRFVAIGASTGGTNAIEFVLRRLTKTSPGIVIVQHMPERFTAMFAERLNELCEIEVSEARSGDVICPGRALIAPGGRHLSVGRIGRHYVANVADGPLVNRHKPAVDVMFRSIAECADRNVLGILMTGMGADGAKGLSLMHERGASTIAQDEQSCVVFGMPSEAIKLGAADRVMPLGKIAEAIVQFGSPLKVAL